MRDTSDKLCREYGLSVIDKPRKAPSRPVWLDEKAGKPTRYNVHREDIENAIYGSNTLKQFEKFLIRKAYEIDFSGKHWKVRLPQYKGFTRLDTLNEKWTPELVHEFIQKIVVGKPEYKDGKRHQSVEIHYNGVGIIREATPEEMEEHFQEHLKTKGVRKTA